MPYWILGFLWFVLPGNYVNNNKKSYGQYQQNIVQRVIDYFPIVPISGCSTAQINKSQRGDVLYASIAGPNLLHLVVLGPQPNKKVVFWLEIWSVKGVNDNGKVASLTCCEFSYS